MNQTTTNLPNRKDLQSSNSLFFGKRMTLPLSGRSLTRGLMKGTLALVLGLGAMQGARAATATWTNNTSTNFLSNSVGKWSNSINPLSGDSWVFANTTGATLTNNFLSGFIVAGITFNLGTFADIINGNSINLSGAIINKSFTNQTLNTAFVLTGSQTITTANNTNSKLVLGGVISDGGSAYGLTFNGINGTTTLTNAATYSGATLVQGSTLVLTNGGSLASSALTITNVGFLSGFTITNAASTNVLWVSSTNGLAVGQYIAGNGISNNVTITGVIDANHITISANTASTGSNSNSAPAEVFTSAGSVQAYGSTLTNVTVAGNGNSYANALGNYGSAGTTNFLASNTTINGILTVQGPTTGMSYVMPNVPTGSIGVNYGYAQLSTGVTVTNLVLNGRLDILGSGSMSLSNISGTGNGNTYYPGAGGGSGGFNIASTYNSANSAGGFGNILNFVGGSVFGGIQQGALQVTNYYATFTQSGTGSVSFAYINGGTNKSLYTFSGGNWFFSQIGQANSYQQAGGTNILVNGANLTVGTNNSAQNGGVWVVGNGTMTFQTNAGAYGLLRTGQTFGLTVSNTGTLNVLGSYTDGGSINITNTTFYMTNNGGSVNVKSNVTVGTAGATNNSYNFVTTNGGVTTVGGNLTVGTSASTTTANANNTVALAGGTLSVAGTLGAGTNAGETNSFNWTAGTFSAGTISATNPKWNGVNSSISNSTLYNTNGNLLVGNSTNGYAGKTAITGNYNQSGSATTTFNILGNNQASTWTGGTTNYSVLTVSGTNTMGGAIVLNMSGYDQASKAALTLGTFGSNTAGSNYASATLNATTTNGISGSFTSNGFTGFSWLNTNGYGAYTLTAKSNALSFGFGTNSYASGNWGSGGSSAWSLGIDPNSSNVLAFFGTGSSTNVTLDAIRTVGGLIFSNASGYTIVGNGASTLTLDGSAFGGNAVVKNQRGNQTIAAPVSLNTSMEVTNVGSSKLSFNGPLSGPGGIQLDSGTLKLSASNSYTGTTLINSGTLQVTGALSSSGVVNVTNGGTLSGTGSVGNVTINSGVAIAPGVGGVGSLTLQSSIWAPGGNYNWVLNDATGTAGVGYSTLSIASILDLSQLSGTNQFNINLATLNSNGVAGSAANFNPSNNYSWTLLTASNGITGFSSNDFLISTKGFANTNGGTFGVSTNGQELDLTYTAPTSSVDTNSSNQPASDPFTNGLVAYYPFNNDVIDYSGSRNDLTSYQGMSFSSNRFGNSNSAIFLNSTTSFASSVNPIGISGNSPRTVSFWMQTTMSVNDAQYDPVDLMGWGRNLDGSIINGEAFIMTLYAPVVGGGLDVQGSAADAVAGYNMADFSYNNWCHVTYVYNGSVNGTSIYLNGSNIPVSTPYYNSLNQLNTPDTVFRLGDRGDGRGLALPGTSFADLRVYNRALESNDVAALYALESGNSTLTNLSQTITFPAIPNQTYGVGTLTLSGYVSSGLALTYSVPTGSASATNNQLFVTGAGTVTVVANQLGDGNYAPAMPVTNSFVVSPANQFITTPQLPPITYGSGPINLASSAQPSGLGVTFSVLSGPATISNNVMNITGAGTVTLIATQPGNSNYLSASNVTSSFVVGRASNLISFTSLGAITYSNGLTTNLNATASSGLPIYYFSANSNLVSISSNVATIFGAGTATIVASQIGNSNYLAATSVTNQLVITSVPINTNYSLITLANFTTNTGTHIYSGLVQGLDGNFYGTAFFGGTSIGMGYSAMGYGTVYRMSPDGTVTTLVNFNGTNGNNPNGGLLLGNDGNFYGTTLGGGVYGAGAGWQGQGYGTIFRLTADGNITTLISFNGTNGFSPYGTLTQGQDGTIYGMTYSGGGFGYGTVFGMTTNGNLKTLVNFNYTNGANPEYSGLVQTSDGNLYGLTAAGGSYGRGTAFRLTTNGVITTLVNFNFTNGYRPGSLTLASDGNFYGTTPYGGLYGNGTNGNNYGTVFRMSTNGALTTLVNFSGTNGFDPYGGLIQWSDGNFYGTCDGQITTNGGFGGGTLFQMTPSGSLTTIATFNGTNGSVPWATMIQGNDGNLYGTTYAGGYGGGSFGTAYKLVPSIPNSNQTNQSISFGALAPMVYGAAPINLTATSSSTLPVSYSSSASNVASISGNVLTVMGAGSATITASQAGNSNWSAATPVTQTLMVSKANGSVSFGKLNQTYDGTAKSVSVTTTPTNLTVGLTYNGTSLAPTNAGSYAVVGSITNANYSGYGSNTLIIAKASNVITPFSAIGNQTYTTNPITINVPVASSGLPVVLSVLSGPATLIGSNAIILSGSGTVVLAADQSGNSNYQAASQVTTSFSVTAGSQSISFGSIPSHTYGDAPFTLNGTASSGLPVSYNSTSGNISISSNSVTILGAGSATITASQPGNANWGAATPVSQTFVVNPATQSINAFATIPNQVYSNGATVTITLPTSSSSLPVTVTVKSGPATINGNTVTLTGSGTVVLAADQSGNSNYQAASQVTTSFSVTAGSQSISFGSIPSHTYGDAPFTLNGTASSGLPVSYNSTSGNISISSNSVTILGAGSATITASQPGNANWGAATPVSQVLMVTKATGAITLGNLSQSYDGTAKSVSVTTTPSSLNVALTYNGSASAPTNAGSYTAVATINNANYSGSVTNTMVIGKGTGAITLGNLSQSYDGTAKSASVTTTPSSLNVALTYNGSASAPTNAGSYTVVGTINDPNYSGSVTNTMVIGKGTGGITLGNLSQSYDGTAKSVSVTTTPSSLNVALTYNGSVSAPTNAGSYTVVGTINNANYSGSVTNTLIVNQSINTISSFAPIADQTYLTNISVIVTPPSSSSKLPVTLSVLSGPATIANNTVYFNGAGVVVIAADQAGNANYAPAQQVTVGINVNQANQTITFPSIGNQTIGALFKPSASASSRLPITFSVISGNAIITNNMVSILGSGTITVEADQYGDSNFVAADPVTRTFVSSAFLQNLTPIPSIANTTYGVAPFAVTPPRSSANLPVVMSIKSGPATIDANNVITATGVGTVVVAADQLGSDSYLPAPQVTTSFIVSKAPQTITLAGVSDQTFSTSPVSITLPTSSSGLPVNLVVSGPARLSGSTLTLTGVGTVTLTATQAGSANYLAASNVTTSFTVSKASQSITLAEVGDQTYKTNPIGITLPTSSSGLTVTLAVSGPARLSGSNLILTGVGTVTLKASQTGNANYLAASNVVTFSVSMASQTIAPFSTIPDKYSTNAPFAVTAPKSSSGLAVAMKVLSGPATMSGTTVTLTGSGTVTLAANQAGNTNYIAAPQITTSFNVSASPQTIASFATIATKTYATTKSFKITLPTSSSKLPVVVSVLSGPATISGTTVTLTGKGTVTLAANQAGDVKFQPATQVTTSFTVQ